MSNPLFGHSDWSASVPERDTQVMTVSGTTNKALILLALMLVGVGWMWASFWSGSKPVQGFMPFFIGGGIVALVAILISYFAPRIAMILGLIYALAEGLFLGGLTMMFEMKYPGLPALAAIFTTATLAGLLLLYRAGFIRMTGGMVKGILGATAGLFLGIAVLFLLNAFGIGDGITKALYGNGMIGIGFSLLCLALAAFNLVADFYIIEQGAANRAPKHVEWLAALGLVTTIVWLYIEILRLLAKLRR